MRYVRKLTTVGRAVFAPQPVWIRAGPLPKGARATIKYRPQNFHAPASASLFHLRTKKVRLFEKVDGISRRNQAACMPAADLLILHGTSGRVCQEKSRQRAQEGHHFSRSQSLLKCTPRSVQLLNVCITEFATRTSQLCSAECAVPQILQKKNSRVVGRRVQSA
jgi:hypothetical protein